MRGKKGGRRRKPGEVKKGKKAARGKERGEALEDALKEGLDERPVWWEVLVDGQVMDRIFAASREPPDDGPPNPDRKRQDAKLLTYLRKVMKQQLTPIQRRYVEEYLLGSGKPTFRSVAVKLRKNPSTVKRGYDRALRAIIAYVRANPIDEMGSRRGPKPVSTPVRKGRSDRTGNDTNRPRM